MQKIMPLTVKKIFSKDVGLLKTLIKLNEAICSEM